MNTEELIKTKIKKPRYQELFKTALKLGYEVKFLQEDPSLVKISDGKNTKYVYKETITLNKRYGPVISVNKEISKKVLKDAGISVPDGITASSLKESLEKMKKADIDYPIVLKPIDAAKGEAVNANINSKEDLEQAIKDMEEYWKTTCRNCLPQFMIEEKVSGQDYRILVLKGKVIACCQRVPASITGDGENTVEEIIEKFNMGRENYPLTIDKEVEENLEKHGLNLKSIVPKDKKIQVKENANISSGGLVIDLTDEISDFFKEIAIKSAKNIGLSFTGIDIMTEDITKNDPNTPYHFIEANSAPDYDIHEMPHTGRKVETTEIYLKEFLKD